MGFTAESPRQRAMVILDELEAIWGSGVWLESIYDLEALNLTTGETIFFQSNASRVAILIGQRSASPELFLDRWAVDIHVGSNHIDFAGNGTKGVTLNHFGRKIAGGALPAVRSNNLSRIRYLAKTTVEP
jgi:hypothetical protein